MSELKNSKRILFTASYVSTQLKPEEQHKIESQSGGGFMKANHMRSMNLQAQEIEQLRQSLGQSKTKQMSSDMVKLLDIAQRITQLQRPIHTSELAALLAPISHEAIAQLSKLSASYKGTTESILFAQLFDRQRKIAPIGRLHLERIEMYPAGVEKGELVFTVPMAPGETVTISHKEWSTSSSEYEEIVQDFFESYSEKGVSEKTDTSMSTENEAKHSNSLNFGAQLSGGYGGVTLTTTLGLTNTNEERESVKNSMQKNREITEKSSARSRQEHKVSMKLETKKGAEDNSFRTLSNTTASAMRVDYYRMMRKWRTDLFRYGLRQTYDLTIPLPGVRIWAQYQRLTELDNRLRTPLQFGLTPQMINGGNYLAEALKVRAQVDHELPAQIVTTANLLTEFVGHGDAGNTRFGKLVFDVPNGYRLQAANFIAQMALWIDLPRSFEIFNVSDSSGITPSQTATSNLTEYIGNIGHQEVDFAYAGVSQANITIFLTYQLLPDTFQTWQRNVWQQIRSAAEARHQEQLAIVQQERDTLWLLLNANDTLSLRRLEREEMIRLIMQWLLGPSSPVIADSGVESTMIKLIANERNFQTAAVPVTQPTFNSIGNAEWSGALLFGDLVKFIHEAVEWENILYFLYPYFWGSEMVGRDKLFFKHSDPEHEKFLRASYARIVLTIRPGFEEDFTALVENGTLSGISTSPYMPITEDIANFAKTNYSGIPPANPELQARPLLFPEQRATWDTMQIVFKQIDSFVKLNGHLPSKLSELSGGPYTDFWGNDFVYRKPGLGGDYDLVSLGKDNEEGGDGLNADISSAAGASLVSTWFDYTPTSALDIEVDTKDTDIA